jgi:hypothetical protein
MNRLCILLTVTVVMVAAPFFGAHEALAELLTGTALNDTLVGRATTSSTPATQAGWIT